MFPTKYVFPFKEGTLNVAIPSKSGQCFRRIRGVNWYTPGHQESQSLLNQVNVSDKKKAMRIIKTPYVAIPSKSGQCFRQNSDN